MAPEQFNHTHHPDIAAIKKAPAKDDAHKTLLASSAVLFIFLAGYLIFLVPTLSELSRHRAQYVSLAQQYTNLVQQESRLDDIARAGAALDARGTLNILKDILPSSPADAITLEEINAVIASSGGVTKSITHTPTSDAIDAGTGVHLRTYQVTVSGIDVGTLPRLIEQIERSSRLFTLRAAELDVTQSEVALTLESAFLPQ